jgi:hypothetical protein
MWAHAQLCLLGVMGGGEGVVRLQAPARPLHPTSSQAQGNLHPKPRDVTASRQRLLQDPFGLCCAWYAMVLDQGHNTPFTADAHNKASPADFLLQASARALPVEPCAPCAWSPTEMCSFTSPGAESCPGIPTRCWLEEHSRWWYAQRGVSSRTSVHCPQTGAAFVQRGPAKCQFMVVTSSQLVEDGCERHCKGSCALYRHIALVAPHCC